MTADTAQDGFVRHVGIAAPLEPQRRHRPDHPGALLSGPRRQLIILFHDASSTAMAARRDFVLNRQPFRRRSSSPRRTGCGSSHGRRYAAGLRRAGGRTELEDIFYNNCLKNGIVPIRLDDTSARLMREQLLRGPEREIAVVSARRPWSFPAYRSKSIHSGASA
jgi:3-isopropylmalate/(R)-2-methylmalate dehydratase small subunit